MKIGIIGYGHVGKAMHKIFKNAIIYDINLKKDTKEEINNSDVIFICVPTPSTKEGKCNTSIVEDILSQFKSKLFILRSTVYVGFTDYAKEKYNQNIVFQPEYYGETVDHPFANISKQSWISFGGEQKDINIAIKVYQTIKNSNTRIIQSPAKDIEMAKYMENAFLAAKVIFCNEMYDIAKSLGVNYNVAREAWIADPRIGSSHTFIFEDNRGYNGKCLPKDINSINNQAKEKGVDSTMLESIIKKNKYYQNINKN